MFVTLEDEQREEICNEIERLFAIPSVEDGSCGMFTMSEPLIKERANHFNSCIETVYEHVHMDNEMIGMYEIISSLDSYFDLSFLVKNVFNDFILEKICDQLLDCRGFKMTEEIVNNSSLSDAVKKLLIDKIKGGYND